MGALRRMDHIIAATEEVLVVLMISAIIVINVLQIFFRALSFNVPAYSGSMNQVLVLWLAMVGGSLATRKAEHIKVDFVSKFLTGRLQHYIMLLINIFAMVICGLLIVYAVDFIKLEYEMQERLTAIPVSLWVLQLIMPVSLSIILFRFFLLALEDIHHIRQAG